MGKFNLWYLSAAVMMAATSAIHAFGGGPEINAPVQASELSPMVRAISAVIWHALTALFLIFAGALAWASYARNEALVWTVLAVCLAFVALFVGIGIASLANLTTMPQWVIFLAISAVLAVGLSRRERLAKAHG